MAKAVSAQSINLLNIGLMLLSFVFALIVPFEAFLFSYAVLGPLHYMTEISWLNQRDFFLAKRRHAAFLVIACLLISLNAIYTTLYSNIFAGSIQHLFGPLIMPATLFAIQIILGSLLFVAFFIIIAFHRAKQVYDFYGWLLLIIFIAFGAQILLPAQYALFSIMLPTIIHVSVFTGLFILSGAIKQKQVSGYIVFILYIILCAAFFIPAIILPVADHITPYAQESYRTSGLYGINNALLSLMPVQDNSNIDIFRHPFGLRIQAFIAFAYTYHYLNWFSKTGLVGWHRVSKRRLGGIISLWLLCIALYAYDYRLGLAVLFFFSLLHVVLEFPLNQKVTGQIIRDLIGRKNGQKA